MVVVVVEEVIITPDSLSFSFAFMLKPTLRAELSLLHGF